MTAAAPPPAPEPPWALLAELTHGCPLRCSYCSNPTKLVSRSAELSGAEWADVFRQAGDLGVVQTHLSGGEPLLRRDLRAVTQRVAAGQSMNEAAQGTWLPPTFAALPGWEDSSALAGESLVAAAELFESQAQAELKLLRAVAPAAAFITVLLIVGFLFSATMLPLVGIIETLT